MAARMPFQSDQLRGSAHTSVRRQQFLQRLGAAGVVLLAIAALCLLVAEIGMDGALDLITNAMRY